VCCAIKIKTGEIDCVNEQGEKNGLQINEKKKG